jgi:hypothetical protein
MVRGTGKVEVEVASFVPLLKPLPTSQGIQVWRDMDFETSEDDSGSLLGEDSD